MDEKSPSKSSFNLCKAGCGYHGADQYGGMCSLCHKETLREQNQEPSGNTENVSSSSSTPITSPIAVPSFERPATHTVDTGSPTVHIASPSGASAPIAEDSSAASSSTEADQTEIPSKAKKKNRCSSCKKKVGLTGFECRCGGIYCSVHRYSDKHGCEFNYKEHGADHIRKNNPVVVGQKVQKL